MEDIYVKINNKNYKLIRINEEAGIVISDGYYDIKETSEGKVYTHIGGCLGNYFAYKGIKKNATVTKAVIEKLKVLTYGVTEEV